VAGLIDSSYTLSFPVYLGSYYDASTTNLTYLIPAPTSLNKTDPLEITLSFLSPITPTSTLRQAIPASYLTVYVSGAFPVNVYMDMNGQWVSGNRGNQVAWELKQTSLGENEKGLKTWKWWRRTEQLFTEYRDRAEWGTLHFTAPSVRKNCEMNRTVKTNVRAGCSPRVWHVFHPSPTVL
jgi:hypothetical protein